MLKRLFLLAGAIVIAVTAAYAAGEINCNGQVVDEQNEPVIGASVVPVGSTNGTTTDIDGTFRIKVNADSKIQISYVGYKTVELNAKPKLGTIRLEQDTKMLKDIVVTQSVARTRVTPVAASNVTAATIEAKLGNQELPEVLKTTPGIWSTRQGGGFGDAKTNMRGFKSENVAVMVNGVPIGATGPDSVMSLQASRLSAVSAPLSCRRHLSAAQSTSRHARPTPKKAEACGMAWATTA